jgi:hypothetical protein
VGPAGGRDRRPHPRRDQRLRDHQRTRAPAWPSAAS